MDYENSTKDNNKTEMGDLISDLEGCSRRKGMSTSKDHVEDSKDRKTESNVGSEALMDDEGKQNVHLFPPKRNSSGRKWTWT